MTSMKGRVSLNHVKERSKYLSHWSHGKEECGESKLSGGGLLSRGLVLSSPDVAFGKTLDV